ncbi:Tyrosine phosphatase family protein [Trichomonas vaginalis G3]|uniref:Tyrosine phosphatase family protein n=1 Tax=Trichomonas vaginalis (strain ATCC PRA-98 / G3) TaxID=412133 RepID=A2DLW1_TRIV3|nr:protein tyrosine phosphatase protein [Trichomonas vaginalis G3]EAY18564.1 Tyrosine phosphatase family protein [Trichomonas vaginalis G3]KAI5491591.1 protein tyrosine phosphatase protein [Trichomonas vaginalis G3]|eukprot:XP_001579550.1 Tyrosine phosphatase family protein [Trichomonas vaginalis G3]
MEISGDVLIPPFRFSAVEIDVFRGAYPVKLNFGFLKTLKLKTMISLIPNPIDEDLAEFCKNEKIENHYFSVPKFIDQIIMTPNTVTQILNLLCDKNNLPAYIHCLNGGHSTGLIVMCLRKLQMWSQRAMFAEFNRFINTFESCEEAFVNNYKATFELTSNRPQWLMHLTGKKSHPTLRVILANETESDDEIDDEEEDDLISSTDEIKIRNE